jgi:undecaprenyl-diphosphatase
MNDIIEAKIGVRKFYIFFLVPFFLLWVTGFIFLVSKGYNNSFLELNKINSHFFDFPMLFLTMFADGGFMACLLIFFFISKNPSNLILLLATVIISGLIAQLLKNSAFNEWHRPPFLFKENVHTVGNYILNHKSFPSGHSTSSAAIYSMIAFIRRKYRWEIIFWSITAILVSYTRIYLGVHFLGDVLAGLLLGLVSTLILSKIIKNINFTLPDWLIITFKVASVVVGIYILINFFVKYY